MIRTAINKQFGNSTEVDMLLPNSKSELTMATSFGKNVDPYELESPEPIGIGQKVLIYQVPNYITSGSGSVSSILYNAPIIFDIPQIEAYLAQIVIECVLTSGGDNTNVEPRLGTKIFKQIQLETKRGCMSMDRTIKPSYTNARLDQLPLSQRQIEQSTYPNGTFNNNTI